MKFSFLIRKLKLAQLLFHDSQQLDTYKFHKFLQNIEEYLIIAILQNSFGTFSIIQN